MRPELGPLPSETICSPGAAMPTHGPAMVKSDGWPSGVSEATDNT